MSNADLAPDAPNTGPLETFDGSGVPNFAQFALGGNPRSSTENGTISAVVSPAQFPGSFAMRFAALDGTEFTMGTESTATIHGVRYTVQASLDLINWDVPVHELPSPSDSVASSPTGYRFRYFRIKHEELPEPLQKGFLRILVQPAD